MQTTILLCAICLLSDLGLDHNITPTFAVLAFHKVFFLHVLNAVSGNCNNLPIAQVSALSSRHRHTLTFGKTRAYL